MKLETATPGAGVESRGFAVGAALPARDAAETRAGLSSDEVVRRRRNHQGNDFRVRIGETYVQIVRRNVFTFINVVLFSISAALVVLGQLDDALATAGLVVFGVVVATYQEGRAKHHLSRLSILTRPTCTAIRDGKQATIDPAEVVLGDVLVVRTGDQIVVDGELVEGTMRVDEALLTGESDLLPKKPGDEVLSGSYCMDGSGVYVARRVGAGSYAGTMTLEARAYRRSKTVLQRDVDTIVRILVVLASQLAILFAVHGIFYARPVVETVQIAAVVVALVPQGLLVMITVSYALAAVRLAGKNIVIQRTNAVESMSHVDVLCLDKTGTLTANRLRLESIRPVGVDGAALRHALGIFAASTESANRTVAAIGSALSGGRAAVREEVPFSSERRWSGLSFGDASLEGTYVLGAPETLAPHLRSPGAVPSFESWTQGGLRVLLFAGCRTGCSLRDRSGEPEIPSGLEPLGLIALADTLRADAARTLEEFRAAGVRLKIISGDDPVTVTGLARQAGLEAGIESVSGSELEGLDAAQLSDVAERVTVFGRILPAQKERLVKALREKGHYVAMIGDGVNDIPALKAANLSLAMEAGSQATRGLADIVLLENSFAALPSILQEGRRVVRGMLDVMRLLLTRTAYVTLIIVGAAIAGTGFPFQPRQNFVVALLTVGIPILGLMAWARPAVSRESTFRAITPFIAGMAFITAGAALGVFLVYVRLVGLATAQTMLTVVATLCGIGLIVLVSWPLRGRDDPATRPEWRPALLAAVMLSLLAVVVAVPALGQSFALAPLNIRDIAAGCAMAALWFGVSVWVQRTRVVERWLMGTGTQPGSGRLGEELWR